MKEWILCIPRVIDIDELSWWFKWKEKNINKLKKSKNFISIKNGNELIDLFKEQNLYNQVFEIEDSQKIDEMHKFLIPQPMLLPSDVSPQLVLFNNYSKKCEDYYLERKIDREFNNSLKLNNLWVFGNSGLGKTALVNRNLLNNNQDYCYCDLSPINITSSEDVLEEILCKIEDKFEVERNCKEKNKIKQISQVLCATCKEIVIVVDELSVKENSVLKEIANDLVKLVTHFCNSSTQEEELKFVVSTILNPKDVIENKSKATEHFLYIQCDDWSDKIEILFDMISKSLNLDLMENKTVILNSSKDSPRILKSIFRKIVASDNLNISSVEQAIKLVESEFVN